MYKTISDSNVFSVYWRDKYGTTGRTMLDMIGFFGHAGALKVRHLLKHHISIVDHVWDSGDIVPVEPEEVREELATWIDSYLSERYGEDWREYQNIMKATNAHHYAESHKELTTYHF